MRSRSLAFAFVALLALLAGYDLSLLYPTAGVAIFAAYATAVVGLVGVVAGRALGQDLAGGEGIKGALANLLTSKKPGEPPPSNPPTP